MTSFEITFIGRREKLFLKERETERVVILSVLADHTQHLPYELTDVKAANHHLRLLVFHRPTL